MIIFKNISHVFVFPKPINAEETKENFQNKMSQIFLISN